MTQSIILGIGTGQCGTSSLAKILNAQPDVQHRTRRRRCCPAARQRAAVLRERFAASAPTARRNCWRTSLRSISLPEDAISWSRTSASCA